MTETDKNDNFPEEIILYKYIRIEHLEDIIKKGEIKVTQLTQSNDPMEFLPVFDNYYLSLAWDDIIKDQPLVICFSTKMSSPAMWGHYTDGHKGACLAMKLKINSPYKNRMKTLKLPEDSNIHSCAEGLLLKVLYDELRPPYLNDAIENQQDRTKSMTILCSMTKSIDWAYEREYRLLLQKPELIITKNEMFFHSCFSQYIVGVILGKNCHIPTQYIEQMLQNIGRNDITVTRARFSLDKFRVEADGFEDSIMDS